MYKKNQHPFFSAKHARLLRPKFVSLSLAVPLCLYLGAWLA
jgi:hypothetical protein